MTLLFEMHIEDGDYLDQPTVRMLFQPLVENAIRYGLGDDEKISIQVFEDRGETSCCRDYL